MILQNAWMKLIETHLVIKINIYTSKSVGQPKYASYHSIVALEDK